MITSYKAGKKVGKAVNTAKEIPSTALGFVKNAALIVLGTGVIATAYAVDKVSNAGHAVADTAKSFKEGFKSAL